MVAVWYWFDGRHVYVATSSRSRKARNLQSNPSVSLMIDARDPAASDGITLAGTAQILTDDVSRKSSAEIHRKYLSEAAFADARVGPVFAAWDDVTIQITPASVIAWDMREADRQFFGRRSREQSRVSITAAALTCRSSVSPHNPICWAVGGPPPELSQSDFRK